MDRTNGKIDKELTELNFQREMEDAGYSTSFFKNFKPINHYKDDQINVVSRLKDDGEIYNNGSELYIRNEIEIN